MRGSLLFGLLVCLPLAAENWPQWRGPTADGVSRESGLPTRWSATENVRWSAPLDGLGNSTPIVWEDRVFVTSQIGDGPLAEGARDFDDAQKMRAFGEGGVRFLVEAFAVADGRPLWRQEFPAGKNLPEVHVKHNLASPSCVTDGERVYAWFGTGLAVALTLDGEMVWRRHLGEEHSAFDVRWGHGSSPAIYEDSLLLLVDHPGDSYLLAVDRRTGRELWKRPRGTEKRSYTTPFVVPGAKGDLLFVNTTEGLEALDARTGEFLWSADEPTRVPVSTPVYHDGVLYSSRGYNSGPFLALRLDGEGPPDDADLRWRVPTGAPYVASLAYANGLIFMATERGIATAVDAETGAAVWRQRLGGVFSASPVVAAGKVYLVEESGKTFVVEAAREFKLVAANDLGERTLASPAVSNGTIYLRTDNRLIAVGGR